MYSSSFEFGTGAQEAPVPPKKGKKVRQNDITLKVGGMGVQLFKGGKNETLVESFLYVNIVGWRYSLQDEELAIEVGVPGGEIERQVIVGTALGEEIGLLMRNHAKSVAKAKKIHDKQMAADDEAKLAKLCGSYRVENRCTMREGHELDTAEVDVALEAGDVIEVTDVKKSKNGTIRLRCDNGWLSNKPHLVLKLDEDGEPIEPQKAPKMDAFDSSSASSSASKAPFLTADEMAEELGLAGDRSFEVTQSHIKKKGVPKVVQLKVGGMGLNLFNGDKVLESHLYFGMKGWNYSKKHQTFDIQFKSVKAPPIQLKTPDGLEIAEMMGSHTQHLAAAKQQAKQNAKEKQSAAQEEEEEDEEDEGDVAEEGTPPDEEYDTVDTDNPGSMIGYYRVINRMQAREGIEADTAASGTLSQGDIVHVFDSTKNSAGGIRLRTNIGYVSMKPHLVKKLKSYTPGEIDESKIMTGLERALLVYKGLGSEGTVDIGGKMVVAWERIFGAGSGGSTSGGAANAEQADIIATLQASLADVTTKSAAAVAKLEQENESLRIAVEAAGDAAEAAAKVAMLEAENSSLLEKLSSAEVAATKAKADIEELEDKFSVLSGKHETLQAELSKNQLSSAKKEKVHASWP